MRDKSEVNENMHDRIFALGKQCKKEKNENKRIMKITHKKSLK